MFFSSKLRKIKKVKHCFFSRRNGYSKKIYKSLNCGIGSNDDKNKVLKNLEFVSKQISGKNDALITLNQKHSNKVICFENEKNLKNKLDGDAIVSKVKNVGIGVLTADCASILLYDPKKEIIGCAHSGWKGAVDGIIQNTIKKFNELDSKNNDLIAVVGPCIKKENYEVKEDFYEKFILNDQKNTNFFEKIHKNKYTFDLRSFINKELFNLNINNVENLEMDTFSQKELFFSYRRSTFNKEKDYGRCISVILMT
jgi:polyphenol oxidase